VVGNVTHFVACLLLSPKEKEFFQNFANICQCYERMSSDVVWLTVYLAVFTIPECDGQTDRQTDRHTDGIAIPVSRSAQLRTNTRGKNVRQDWNESIL